MSVMALITLITCGFFCVTFGHHNSFQPLYRNYEETDQRNASVAIRISTSGLNFFSSIGHKIVTHELPKIDYPDFSLPISGGPGKGVVYVRGLRIPEFESPTFNFALEPRQGITWHSQDGFIRIRGRWKASYTWLVTMNLSGWLEVKAIDIRSLITLGVYKKQNKPQVEVYNCSVGIGEIDLEIGGGVIPWIVNLFRADLSATLRKLVNSQFCETTRSVLLDEANNALLTLPTHLQVTEAIFLDYSFTDNPVVTDSYVGGAAYVDVVYGNRTCDFVPSRLQTEYASKSLMLNVWFSETIFNCLAESIHQSGLLQYIVDQSTYSKFSVFLSTSCHIYQICLGRFFPILRKKWPHQHIDLVFHSADSPLLDISREGITLNATVYVDLHLSPAKNNTMVLARIGMNSTSNVIPAISNNRITGRLNGTTLHLTEMESQIGNISQRQVPLKKDG
jgi:hypothetical protein